MSHHALDAKVADVLDRPQAYDKDEDSLLDELENDDSILDGLREQRMQQLHEEYRRAQHQRGTGFGSYQEVKDEKTILDTTTSTKYCVVHFYSPDFHRCQIMNGHLEELATAHFDTRFLRINVDNAPFLVTKLKVQVLPCVLAFVDGVTVDRIIGFEGLGRGTDTFTTQDLESRLARSGALVREKISSSNPGFRALNSNHNDRADDEDDGDDLDDWE